MKQRLLGFLGAALLALTGCGAPSYHAVGLPRSAYGAKGTEADWTVLIHMASDNNLYRYALEDLNEMEAGLSGEKVNVLVLFDGQRRNDSCVYRIRPDTAINDTIVSEKLDLPEVLGSTEIDSGDPQVLGRFMKWAAQQSPARRTMLTIWNHGGGIFPVKKDSPLDAYAWDDRGTNMETRDLSETILPAFTKAAGRPLEVLSFDACLMGHLEIGYQVKGLANYFVASEDAEPQGGWDYQTWISALCRQSGMDGAQLGKTLVDSYVQAYQPGGIHAGTGEVTLSAVDLRALERDVIPAVNRLAEAGISALPALKDPLDKVRGWEVQSFYDSKSCDLGDLARAIAADPALAPLHGAALQVGKAVEKMTISSRSSAPKERPTGLVLYFPRSYDRLEASYGNSSTILFAQERWDDFLRAYKGQ